MRCASRVIHEAAAAPRPRRRGLAPAVALAVGLGLAGVAHAQIDPEPRANLELGVGSPLKGNAGMSGYGLLLWNQPHFLNEDDYLRLVFTPTYLRADFSRDRWPGPNQAVGLGLSGGLFRYNFDDFRDGHFERHESFWGHGGAGRLAYYPYVKLGELPVRGEIRIEPQYLVYQRSGDTSAHFRLPHDTPVYTGRAGVRLGGVPPELLPKAALEISLWHETTYRQEAESYGFPDSPQTVHHLTQQSWARAGGIFPLFQTHTAQLFVTAGTTEAGADALSSFRLGGAVPFRSELPLWLHGYFADEVFARRFWLVNGAYRFPLWPGTERVRLQLAADYAQVDYLPGRSLPRRSLRGVGTDVIIAITPRMTLVLGYGYGVDAPRNGRFGGHEATVLLEAKL